MTQKKGSATGLTKRQINVLLALKTERRPVGAPRVAFYIGGHRTGAMNTLEALVRRKLVRWIPVEGPEPGGSSDYALTRAGRAALRAWAKDLVS